jgi:hydroxymethylbilane synthase
MSEVRTNIASRQFLRVGSRGSQLAWWQSNHISALLRARGHEVEIEVIHTTGDARRSVVSGNGVFSGIMKSSLREVTYGRRTNRLVAVHIS